MKRAIWLIGILLLTALALAACGENEEYPYSLTVKNGCLRVTEGGEDVICVDFDMAEYTSSRSPDREEGTTHCYDGEQIYDYLKRYLPRKLSMRPREHTTEDRWDLEASYTFYLDFDDGYWLNIYVEPDGRVFVFYHNYSKRPEVFAEWVSAPGVVKLENVRSLYEQLSGAQESIACDCEPYISADAPYEFYLRLTEEGDLTFGHLNETTYTLDAEGIEHVYVYGRGRESREPNAFSWSVDRTFYLAPEKQQILPEFLSDTVWLRRFDRTAETDLWIDEIFSACIDVTVDHNGGRWSYFYVTLNGRIVFIDADGHWFISEPGACDGKAVIGAIGKLNEAYFEKYEKEE